MKKQCSITTGSVIGRSHKIKGKNNQDAFHYVQTDDYTIAIVTDGCSGATTLGTQDDEVKNSEVGAHLGSLLIAKTLEKHVKQHENVFDDSTYLGQQSFWHQVHADVLAQLRVMGNSLHDNLYLVMKNYFLYTIVGAVVTKHKTCIFSLGDGWYALNGDTYSIEPETGMKQPYLAYGITGYKADEISYNSLFFKTHHYLDTKDLLHLALGSDGVHDLERNATTPIPGKTEKVGPISQFWTEPIYLTNPAWLQNRLNTINTDRQKINWDSRDVKKHHGLLPDDTTMIIIRNLQNS